MKTEEQQIVDAYKRLGMTPEDISEQFGIDQDRVRVLLRDRVPSFRLEIPLDEKERLSKLALEVLEQVALYGDTGSARAKAAQYLREEVTERNSQRAKSPQEGGSSTYNMNITLINEGINAAKRAVGKLIEVEGDVKQLAA